MIQSILELRHLRTLAALRDSGSVSRAAELLNLTQSALSHQLRLLEEQYGAPLFERKSVPIQFSPAGLRLLQLADGLLPRVSEAERDIARLAQGMTGQLRIAVECHTCFDWLMPAIDEFRRRWPEVELDIVSGFHADPVELLRGRRADLAIVSERDAAEPVHYFPLFRFEIVALLAQGHPLEARPHLTPRDFIGQTLITYPVPDDMLDIMRKVLTPRGINPTRRTAELTIVILQLVASRRGLAALPRWAVQSYLDRDYVVPKPIGKSGLSGELFAACPPSLASQPFMEDFVVIVRESSFLNLRGIELL